MTDKGGIYYVEVAVGRLTRLFHYRFPSALDARSLQPGVRLLVPFRRRLAIAYFVRVVEQPSVSDLKEVLTRLDAVSPLPPPLIKLLQWISEYYLAPFGAVIQCALPKEGYKLVRRLELTEAGRAALELGAITFGPVKQACLHLMKGPLTDLSLRRKIGTIPPLAKRGDWIKQHWDISVPRHTKEPCPLDAAECFPSDKPPSLNADQKAALDQMNKALRTGQFSPFLLHGVTGSGKTEVYLRLIEKALLANKGAIVLVPEIGLTPQLAARFKRRFGKTVALLHSGLSSSERYSAWRRIQEKEVRIVIGARSALFAPVDDIGVMIVDEEHDSSYKQEEGVRYHARDAALVYGKILNAVVVLGSATPSMESLSNGAAGKYTILSLPKRVSDRPLPAIVLVDLCARETWVKPFLTQRLIEAIGKRLVQKEQVILFVNRRGHCPSLVCGSCGHLWACQNCSVALAWHKTKKCLLCHYCGFRMPPPDLCPDCNGTRLLHLGVGTEQIEEALTGLFPQARILRMDRDTTVKKASYEKMVAAMEAGEADILIGTQMVAKGHDFPNVTLVGVICADHSLNLPDFRASERTFHLLAQVAGRAGRGAHPGEVLLQTFQPENPFFNLLPDCARWYDLEKVYRQEAGYPPYTRLTLLRLCHRDEAEAARLAKHLAAALKSGASTVLGPAPAPLTRIRKDYRYQILLKGKDQAQLRRVVQAGLDAMRAALLKGARIIVDVDPQHLM